MNCDKEVADLLGWLDKQEVEIKKKKAHGQQKLSVLRASNRANLGRRDVIANAVAGGYIQIGRPNSSSVCKSVRVVPPMDVPLKDGEQREQVQELEYRLDEGFGWFEPFNPDGKPKPGRMTIHELLDEEDALTKEQRELIGLWVKLTGKPFEAKEAA